MISHAEQWGCTSKNLANKGTHFFCNGTVVGCTGTIVDSNDTVADGMGGE